MTATADRPLDLDRMRREAEEMRAAKAAHRQAVEARRTGSLALVEPGFELWSRDRRYADDDAPIGGVVVEVEWVVDTETGESVRTFTCLSTRPEHGRSFSVRRVREAELGEANIEPPNTATLKGLVARLDEAAAKAMGKRGPVLAEVAQFQQWAMDLTLLIVFGARRG